MDGFLHNTTVRHRDGNLNVPYLYDDGDEVVLNWNWLDYGWHSRDPALRVATHFISPEPRLWFGSFVCEDEEEVWKNRK